MVGTPVAVYTHGRGGARCPSGKTQPEEGDEEDEILGLRATRKKPRVPKEVLFADAGYTDAGH